MKLAFSLGVCCRREFEEILNTAWSSAMLVGKRVAFDEQMITCVALFSSALLRHNKFKPI